MLKSTMPGINTNIIQSITSELDQITLKVISKEAVIKEVKGAAAVPDNDLTANVLQSLMTKEVDGEALNPEAEQEAKDAKEKVILDFDEDIEETKHYQEDKRSD